MPKITQVIPDELRPFIFHGVDLQIGQDVNAIGDCPFCGRNGKFSVNRKTGQWRCYVCAEGTDKGGGNATSFLRLLWDLSDARSNGEEALAKDRGLLWPDTITNWGLCKSILTGDWLAPGYGVNGKLSQIYKWCKDGKTGRMRFLSTPKVPLQPFGTVNADKGYVYVTEGLWDAMALWEALRSAKPAGGKVTWTASEAQSLFVNASIIAVPNCGTVGEPFRRWLPLFADKKVILLFDSDHPIEQADRTLEPAGFAATKRAVKLLASSAQKPESVSWLNWGPGGFDPARASGFDVRDWLSKDDEGKLLDHPSERVKRLAELLDRVELVPDEWSAGRLAPPSKSKSPEPDCLPCEDWEKLRSAWRKALKWSDGLDKALAVMLAAVLSTDLIGDQLWIKVVSAPSSGKSVLCEALAVAKNYILSKSTLRGFHSGFRQTSDKDEDNSLLALAQNKTLVIKDGDTLLQAPNKEQILSEARDIYDRVSRTHYRNKASKDYEGINMTFILCGTESLRALDTSELGERMLDCAIVREIDPHSEREVALRVAYRAAREMAMQADGKMDSRDGPEMVLAKRLTGGYVNFLRENGRELMKAIEDEEWWIHECVNLGTFVAYLRARPSSRQKEKAQREMSYRLTSQFVRLSKCLAVGMMRGKVDRVVMARSREVAMDTARGRTFDLIAKLREKGEEGATAKALGVWLGHDELELKNYLSFLRKIKALKAVERKSHKVVVWKLSDEVARLWREVVEDAQDAE